MDAFQEYALLIAIAIPMVLIAGINMFLALTGERGTLLLPIPEPLATPGVMPTDVQPASCAPPMAMQPANDARVREVA
jgi:hypothetical protein